MKALRTIAVLALATFLGTTVYAQDDFYPSSKKKAKKSDEANYLEQEQNELNDIDYSTATDYYYNQKEKEIQEEYNRQLGITDSTTYYEDEYGNVRITNNYYNGDNYDFDNEYYDYEYTSRIRRFHRPTGRYGYYDDYYTNYYYYNYDPYYYGTSVYVSYGWWYPSPWRWSVGWGGYYGGWGWSYGWGYGSPWHWGYGGGWYGSSYWSGYNHGYMNGYYDGLYASGNYYNSYDRNSHYYGKRGNTGGSDGYGGTRATTVNTGGKTVSFGEKYEQAVRSNPGLNTIPKSGVNSSPKNNTYTPSKGNVTTPVKQSTYGTAPKTNPTAPGTNPKPYTPPVKTNESNTPKPYIAPTKPHVPNNKPYTAPTKPQTSPKPYTPPTRNNVPKTNPKPSYTPQPRNNSKPTYTKPSPKQNYNPPKSSPKPSYSPPSRSGGSYNSGGGSKSGGSYGGSRKSPR